MWVVCLCSLEFPVCLWYHNLLQEFHWKAKMEQKVSWSFDEIKLFKKFFSNFHLKNLQLIYLFNYFPAHCCVIPIWIPAIFLHSWAKFGLVQFSTALAAQWIVRTFARFFWSWFSLSTSRPNDCNCKISHSSVFPLSGLTFCIKSLLNSSLLHDSWCTGVYMWKGSIKLVFKYLERSWCLSDLRTFCHVQNMSRKFPTKISKEIDPHSHFHLHLDEMLLIMLLPLLLLLVLLLLEGEWVQPHFQRMSCFPVQRAHDVWKFGM